jgi:RNA polymerase sigma factor (sigma-70 family)
MTASSQAAIITGTKGFQRPWPIAKRTIWPVLMGNETKVEWAKLIGRVSASGDLGAFRLLFEYFAPRIKGFMLKTGCSADEAEEIAQKTMIAVWRKAKQFDERTTGASAWIFTIARNIRIDAARRTGRDRRLAQSVSYQALDEAVASAEQIVARTEDKVRVTTALERLSLEQSTVIRMSYLEGMPHAEISERLAIPLGTVKSRIRLAMDRLKALLEEPL